MRYLPKSPSDRQEMLRDIGVATIDDLFAHIPAELRLNRDLKVPRQHAESEVIDYFKARASEMAARHVPMIGAGAYAHYRPVVIDSLISRGEFFTSYTPYQAEIAQGTLQAIFEFQSMICELTAMEVANASMYDGSTGCAEAVLMACRVAGRKSCVVASNVHPEYRDVLANTVRLQNIPISTVPYAPDSGRADLKAIEAAMNEDTACILVQSPNFFGVIEDVPALAELAHKKGALLVVAIAEALSLGIVKPPVEADIVVLEAQSFGVPMGFGGPHCGVIATKEKFVRQIPGRLIGETKDKNGNRGYVLTLSTREQHIRREKATSNICTNQGLVALMATIYMCVYGKEGLKDLAKQNLAKAHYAATEFGKKAKLLFAGSPRFNEFVVQTKEDSDAINKKLLEHKILGGLPLKKYYPELGNAQVWCCTEMVSRENIDAAAKVVGQ